MAATDPNTPYGNTYVGRVGGQYGVSDPRGSTDSYGRPISGNPTYQQSRYDENTGALSGDSRFGNSYAQLNDSQRAYLAGIENWDPSDPTKVAALQDWIKSNNARASQQTADVARFREENPNALLDNPLTNTTENYVGRSADGKTDVAYQAAPSSLSRKDFTLQGQDQIRGNYGGVAGDAMSDSAMALGQAGANAQQSRGLLMQNLNQTGPSAAEAQLRMGQDANARAAMSLARSGRGYGSGASAMRQAQMQAAEGAQQTNQQAALLRAQESAQRTGQLQQFYGQDQGAQGQAQSFATGQRGVANQATQGLTQLSAAQQQANADRAKTNLAATTAVNQSNAQMANYREMPKDNTGAILGAIGSVVGAGAMMASDERSKTQIQSLSAERDGLRDALRSAASGLSGAPAASHFGQGYQPPGAELRAREQAGGQAALLSGRDPGASARMGQASGAAASQALAAAPPYAYNYKPGVNGGEPPERRMFGQMAQDLEQTPVGASVVKEDANGQKMVDTGRLALVNAAAGSDNATRLDQVEQDAEELRKRLGLLRSAGMPNPTQPGAM